MVQRNYVIKRERCQPQKGKNVLTDMFGKKVIDKPSSENAEETEQAAADRSTKAIAEAETSHDEAANSIFERPKHSDKGFSLRLIQCNQLMRKP